jgi:hypothetical protein
MAPFCKIDGSNKDWAGILVAHIMDKKNRTGILIIW